MYTYIDYNKQTEIWKDYLLKKNKFDYLTLYIHFPFCEQKCTYCMHKSIIIKDLSIIDHYIDNLEEQFKKSSKIFNDELIRAIYFGGGSQSLLTAKQIKRLLNIVDKYWNLEKTLDNMMNFEMHPSQINDDKISILKDSYINRISMGIQSFDKNVIESVNRIYTDKKSILNTYEKLRNNFSRVNIDFMYGLDNQTDESFYSDIKTMMDLDANRITIYGYNNYTQNRIEKNEDIYQKKLIHAFNHLINNCKNKDYNFSGSKRNYSEYNILTKKGSEKYIYKYPYNTQPLHFNNCIGFSMGENVGAVSSFFIPLKIHVYKQYLQYIYEDIENFSTPDFMKRTYNYRNAVIKHDHYHPGNAPYLW